MAESNPGRKPHSAEYFGDYRDFWWNRDFLELMATRLNLGAVRTVLDAGCGVGHWGQVLAPFIATDACITGVDREEIWISRASERAKQSGLAQQYRYQVGDVTALSFPDNTFDLVTCQTVLIHLRDPGLGLREMLRVLKPGGTLLVAEPNNLANHAMFSSLSDRRPVEEMIQRLAFGLLVERGKQALGLGFNSVGDLIPGYLAELGARNVKVYLSDKAVPLFPPYAGREQEANIDLMREWASRRFIGWEQEEVSGYFLAGGGQEKDFDVSFDLFVNDLEEAVADIDKGTYHAAGGTVMYLIAAGKN